ncbi:MAG TPA: hypothetical protein VJO33_02380 [Gemmatimonadaceae bacterium]|nr:hypothetical protein [Gemmatimonadaceae bacterium]
MRIRLAIPDRLVTPEALEAALEATSLANEQAILRGEVPPLSEAIRGGVRWKPEPYLDGEHFDLAHLVANRKWGDCDDLAPWLTGELRATGEDPGAVSRVYKTGADRWHVVTQTSDGTILDPSRWAGMGKKSASSVVGVSGKIARPFARTGEGALCVVPHERQYWSRVDLPFPDGAGHIASHARARTPEDALDRAIAGAIACGEEIESDLCERARIMGAMLLSDFDLETLNGDEGEVGSFFGKLIKTAVPFAAGFIPGVGPLASAAAKGAMSLASKKKRPSSPPVTSAVRALSRGGGKSKPTPDTITHAPTGAVSVPIETPPAAKGGSSNQPAMLFYHPTASSGPVVMRF